MSLLEITDQESAVIGAGETALEAVQAARATIEPKEPTNG